ncbi:hypothetical protein AX14_013828 [Amanita brunnescens Koide BX004]|nr:hypothetical protein AX14_013828 [Amanita brunnescens Koide BX004]
MKFTAFGSVLALALIGLAAAAPPTAANANPAPQTGTTSTQPKTDPSTADCVPSQCKAGNKNVGDVFCGNQAADPNCLNGHLFKADGNGLACDLGLSNSC